MELNKVQREALIDVLEKLNEQKDLNEHVRMHRTPEKDQDMIDYSSIGDWLNDLQIAVVKKTLIDNEIDY